jgi:hypothetical protein
MQDIQRVFGSYLEYVQYITDALNNIYKNINAMPLIAYSKHAMNTVHEKVRYYGFLFLLVIKQIQF